MDININIAQTQTHTHTDRTEHVGDFGLVSLWNLALNVCVLHLSDGTFLEDVPRFMASQLAHNLVQFRDQSSFSYPDIWLVA